MKYLSNFLISLTLLCAFGCGSKGYSHNKIITSDSFIVDEKRDNYNNILPDSISNFLDLDLYLGMERDTFARFTQTDSILDKLLNLSKMEKKALGFVNEYKYFAYASLGLYIDTIFPTDTIRYSVLNFVDSLMIGSLNYIKGVYDHNVAPKYSQKINEDKISVKGFKNYWGDMFDIAFNNNENRVPDSTYTELSGIRHCTTAHRIYENDTIITYAFINCWDYNGSLGYKKSANYITFDKRNATVLQIEDICQRYGENKIEQAIEQSYKKTTEQLGLEPKFTGTQLLGILESEKAHNECGIAQIEDYILIYYQPYTIGCGAEGQYNLILNLD